MASNNRGYWSYSWELLTRDEGWHKPLLVLAAARMVPIVGPFGADGYGLEWARLTAWGVDSSPKQKNVDVWGCIKAGARAFVVGLGYGLAFACVRLVLSAILGEVLGSLLGVVVALAAAVLIHVAKLRATIYQSIGAGYQVERICDMVKRDYKGLLRIAGLMVLLTMAYILLSSMLYGIVLISKLPPLISDFIAYERYGYTDDWMIISSLMATLASAMPALFVMSYLTGIVQSATKLISVTAVGLWMRQFDVAKWGESSDPLPSTAPSAESGYTTTSAGAYASRQSYDAVAPVADEPRTTAAPAVDQTAFGIPVPNDQFPRSSEEMAQAIERERAAMRDEASAAVEQAAHEAIESLDQPINITAVYDEENAASEPEAAAKVEAAATERDEAEEVRIFSLTDVTQETDEPLTQEQLLAQTRAAIQEAKPAAADTDERLTQEQLLAQTRAAIEAADMTVHADVSRDEKPATEAPAVEAPTAEIHAGDMLTAEVPVAEKSTPEAPAAEAPVAKAPAPELEPVVQTVESSDAPKATRKKKPKGSESDWEIIEVVDLTGTPHAEEAPEEDGSAQEE